MGETHTKEGKAVEHSRGHESDEENTQVLAFCRGGEGGRRAHCRCQEEQGVNDIESEVSHPVTVISTNLIEWLESYIYIRIDV